MKQTSPAPQGATLRPPVRDGESPATGKVLPGRAAGLHLSANGGARAERFARRLAGLPGDARHSPPPERMLRTARPAGPAPGLEAGIEAGPLECGFGEWAGASRADLARLPQRRRVQGNPSSFRVPGGEAFTQFRERIVAAPGRRGAGHPGGVAACFSHADPLKVAVAHPRGAALDNFRRRAIFRGAVPALSLSPGRAPEVHL